MKNNRIAIILLISFAVIVPLKTMEPEPEIGEQNVLVPIDQSISTDPLPSAEKPRPLSFYWGGELVGRISADTAKEYSPALKAQLENESLEEQSRYRINFEENEYTKDAVVLFAQLLSGTVPATFVSMKSDLVLELIMLFKQFDITRFDQALSSTLAQILNNPGWYNAQEFPLSELYVDIARMVASHPLDSITIKSPDKIKKMVISPDNNYVIIVTNKEATPIYDLQSGQIVMTIQQDGWGRSAVFSPNSRYVAIKKYNHMKICDLLTKQIILDIDAIFIAFSPDSNHVVIRRGDTEQIYDLLENTFTKIKRGASPTIAGTFSPDGKYIATGSSDGAVNSYDLNGNIVGTIAQLDGKKIDSIAFSPDGKHIAAGSSNGAVNSYDLSGNIVAAITQPDGKKINTVAFSPDGKYLAITSGDKTVKIYDLKKQQIVTTMQHNNNVTSTVFSPGSKYVFTTSGGNVALRIFDLYEKNAEKALKKIAWYSYFTPGVFSPVAKYAVTLSGDNKKEAKIYDILSERRALPTVKHDNNISLAAFSPDGRYLATASDDYVVRITPTPLGFDSTNLLADQIFAIITLVRLALDKREDQSQQILLSTDGWVYKTFTQLPNSLKDRLQDQYPEIRNFIDQATVMPEQPSTQV
ncbi:WD40 repeat domain-containing protein [Candidatus Dependentiae bacterium]|nr:WD40 repeat domain-containing protein [Candidatus Dependentiae bacterium]